MKKLTIAVLVAIALGMTACTSSTSSVSQSSGSLQVSTACDSGSYRTKSSNESAPSWLTIDGEITKVLSTCDNTTLAFIYGVDVSDADAKALKAWYYRDGVWTAVEPSSIDMAARTVTVSSGQADAHWTIGWKR